jgi:hypothetical protein
VRRSVVRINSPQQSLARQLVIRERYHGKHRIVVGEVRDGVRGCRTDRQRAPRARIGPRPRRDIFIELGMQYRDVCFPPSSKPDLVTSQHPAFLSDTSTAHQRARSRVNGHVG